MPVKDAEFVKLLTENQSRIYGFIVSLIPCFNEADDILQETIAVMWEKRQDFTLGTNFVAWGARIAYFKVLDHRKSKQRDHRVIFSDEMFQRISQNSPMKEGIANAYTEKLKQCLVKLKGSDRNLVELRYWNDLGASDIAQRLQMSIRSVYYHLARIQGLLLLCVEKEDA